MQDNCVYGSGQRIAPGRNRGATIAASVCSTLLVIGLVQTVVAQPSDGNAQPPDDQQKTAVQGTLADDQGAPLAGATVTVRGTTLWTITDAAGKYTLVLPAAGDYILEATPTGHGPVVRPFTIAAGVTLTVDLVASKAAAAGPPDGTGTGPGTGTPDGTGTGTADGTGTGTADGTGTGTPDGTGTGAGTPDGAGTGTGSASDGDGKAETGDGGTSTPEPAAPVTEVTISGRVLESEGGGLIGATIEVRGTDILAVSEDGGRYSLTLPKGGEYTLDVGMSEFASQERSIAVQDGQTLELDVTLSFDLLDLTETIVVTGTVSGKTKLESPIAVSTLDQEYLQQVGARNAADAFKSIPGFYIESSGGEGNANVTVRGLPHSGGGKFTQIQEDGLDIVQYGDIMFGNTDIWVRLDQSVERVEGIRGGSAGITASNAPGGIINLISKTGGTPGGSLAQTVGLDYKQFRLDFDYGSPVTENLRFHVGGFYRTDDGIRSPGFTANKGGQVKANVTRTFDGGYVRGYVKYLDDRSIAYLPIPLARKSDDSDEPTGIPGFDPNYGTMHSRDLLRLHARTPYGDEVDESLDVGMNPRVKAFGLETEYDLGKDWTVSERFRKTYVDGQFNGIFSFSGSPVNFDDFAQSQGLTNYSYRYVSGQGAGENLTQQELQNLNGNGLVVPYGWWAVDIPLQNFTNKIELTRRIRRADVKADITAGYYHNHNVLSAVWWWHNVLADVSDNTRRLDLIDNTTGQAVTVDGILQYGTLHRDYWADTRIDAPYLSVDVTPIKNLSIVAGLRYDWGRTRGATEQTENFDYDVNEDGIIDAPEQNVAYGSGRDIPFDHSYNGISYSLAGNYVLNKDNALFLGHSMGRRAPADRTFAFNATEETADGFPADTKFEKVFQTELGYKFRHKHLGLFATAFMSNFPDFSFADLRTNPNTGLVESVTEFSSVRTLGLELEAQFNYRGFSMLVTGTVQDTVFTEFTQNVLDEEGNLVEQDYSGNTVPGSPVFYYLIRPSYNFRNRVNLGLTVLGNTSKWLDNGNTQKLAGFNQVNASIAGRLTGKLSLAIVASNLLNSIGLTEGNPRAVQLTPAGNLFFARPIMGRSAIATLRYDL